VTIADRREAPYRSIFDRAMIAIAYTTADGRILEANAKLCQMLEYTLDELRELSTGELTHGEDRAREAQLRRELLCGERALISDQQRYLRKSGAALWVKRMATLDAGAGSPNAVTSKSASAKRSIMPRWGSCTARSIAGC
jgi:PAS domain S-box-containing protein